MYGVIYKITNRIDGKLYFGQTRQNPPEKRWKQHKHGAKNGHKTIPKLFNAMRCHGIENFQFEVVCECETLEELNRKEIEYISKNNTLAGGYNANHGGDNYDKTPETRAKMRDAQKGRIITEEAREKLRQANLGKKQSPETLAKKSASRTNVPWSEKKRASMVGRTNTEETKQKMSEAQKGRTFTEETKKKMRLAKQAVRKVSDEQVAEIRENKEGLLQYELAKKYNVSKQLISNIINRKRGY